MKKPRKVLPPKAITAMFVVAVLLLLSGSIGGTRAALTYYSETYRSEFEMYDIGVTLLEQGEHDTGFKQVSWRNYDSKAKNNGYWNEAEEKDGGKQLLTGMLEEGESLKPGKEYTEQLRVLNSGRIDQYVRVTIYKYWLDAEGNKMVTDTGETVSNPTAEVDKNQELSPDWIDLHLTEGSGWLVDTKSSTPERTVLYYSQRLSSGEMSPLFADTLTINDAITRKVSQETDGNGNIVTTFDYDGVKFQIEVEVDAVQDHNAADAIWSAWGRKVTVSDGTLSLQ
ncbi:MAG: hypothetical protein HFI33_09065 [Lachnospiraceae bacterium]|nr:hypothetical protein [Lachnospiraceae bacterium]